jgi:esterase/lipase superfamily enzyme
MQQDPATFSRIGSMIWLAPDVDATAIREPWFRAAVERMRTGLFVHYSPNDTTLSVLSRAANGTPRLGATGPGSDGGAPIGKLKFIDMTDAFGADAVHTGYLRKNSPSLPLIARQIAIAH